VSSPLAIGVSCKLLLSDGVSMGKMWKRSKHRIVVFDLQWLQLKAETAVQILQPLPEKILSVATTSAIPHHCSASSVKVV